MKQSEINQLLKKYGEATDESDKNSLRDQILKATTSQFELRQQVREREIEQLKKRLADVEATVQKRNELKDNIVEKRVADILREPDQLEWESLGVNSTTTYAPGIIRSTPLLPAPLRVSTTARVPRTIVRVEESVAVDAEGNQKVVQRPIYETVYEDQTVASATSRYGTYMPGPTVPQQYASPELAVARVPTAVDSRQTSSTNMTVAEAEARVRIAQRKHDTVMEQHEAKVVGGQELQSSEAELELAKLGLARAQSEYEGRAKLYELDVRQAEANYQQAKAILVEATEVNRRAPNSIPEPQLAARRAAVEQSQISLERAKAVSELHQKTNQPTPKSDDQPTAR